MCVKEATEETVSNIIHLNSHVPADPILRKGDIVRLVYMDEYADSLLLSEDIEQEDVDHIIDFEGAAAIVTSIDMIYPLSNVDAPGQAAYVSVMVPMDDGTAEGFLGISISHLRRVIGPDLSNMFSEEMEL